MVRFSDSWVVDRTMFEYVSDGTCACCGLPYLFQPDGIQGMIAACTDLETDAAENELNAVEKSPWPPQIREQIWGDRVRLRLKMKKEMPNYKNLDVDGLRAFCLSNTFMLRKIIQMPRSVILDITKDYGIHSAYCTVLQAVSEQVANFKLTKYDVDGRSDEELAFEKHLKFNKRGPGFTLELFNKEGKINESVLDVFMEFARTLGGPKLLKRRPRVDRNDNGIDNEDEDNEVADEVKTKDGGPSFQGDRRLIRLLISRYWVNQLSVKFNESTKEKE